MKSRAPAALAGPLVTGAALALAVLAGSAGVAGCGADRPATAGDPRAGTVAVPARAAERSPAAAAGGACQLLDFFAVEELVGDEFEVAAAAQRDSTATCVLQRSAASYPDLTLAVSPAAVTPAVFKASVVPPGSTELTGLGQAAYRVLRPAAAGADPAGPGAAVEIGWLTRTKQLMVLRYRLPATQPERTPEDLLPRLVDLARFLDPA